MSLGIVSRSFRRGKPHALTTVDGRPLFREQGKVYFVDANRSGSGDGKSLESPFTTMAEAFAKIASGDTIYTRGKIREQLVTPVQVFDVSVLGLGNRPRHADSTPAGGEISASTWMAPASGAVVGKANVRVLQQGWVFENILFAMEGATAAGIELVRDAGAGNAERDASHAYIRGCKFAGAGIGVRFGVAALFTEIVNHAVLEDNHFIDNTTAISSAIQVARAYILNNMFNVNTNHLVAQLGSSIVVDNVFSNHTTSSIVLTGGAGKNIITKNYLSGTFSVAGGYAGSNANDEWGGNDNAAGHTTVDPV